jgi:hypothetical protein
LRAVPGARIWITQRCDVLRRDTPEFGLASACGIQRLSHDGDRHQQHSCNAGAVKEALHISGASRPLYGDADSDRPEY